MRIRKKKKKPRLQPARRMIFYGRITPRSFNILTIIIYVIIIIIILGLTSRVGKIIFIL